MSEDAYSKYEKQPKNTDRTQIAKLAAHTRWAHEEDRSAATRPAREGMQRKFERLVDPDGVLPPDELEKRVDSARRAHFQRLALKSAQARRRKAGDAGQ